MSNTVFFGVPVLVTIVVTVVLCRVRLARKKRVSVGTLFTGALSVPVIAMIVGTCFDPLDFWTSHNKGPGAFGILTLAALITVVCALPAGVVVAYYQRQRKRDE